MINSNLLTILIKSICADFRFYGTCFLHIYFLYYSNRRIIENNYPDRSCRWWRRSSCSHHCCCGCVEKTASTRLLIFVIILCRQGRIYRAYYEVGLGSHLRWARHGWVTVAWIPSVFSWRSEAITFDFYKTFMIENKPCR